MDVQLYDHAREQKFYDFIGVAHWSGFNRTEQDSDKAETVDLGDEIHVVAGRSPLYWAAERDDIRCLTELLAKGADPNEHDFLGWSPLIIAGYLGNVGAVQALLESKRVCLDYATPTGLTIKDIAIHRYLFLKDYKLLILLHKHGIPIDIKSLGQQLCGDKCKANVQRVEAALSCTTLPEFIQRAFWNSNYHPQDPATEKWVAKFFELHPEADVNSGDFFKRTGLFWAAECNLALVCRYLIEEKHADVSKADIFGWPPVIAAVLTDARDALCILCKLDVNRNKSVRDDKGRTLLELAKERGRVEIVQFLSGESQSVNNSYGEYSIAIAASAHGITNTSLPDYMLSLHDLDDATSTKLVQEYLAVHPHVDLNEISPQYGTPLHLAAKHNKPMLCGFLVQQGALVDCLDATQKTPLIAAVISGSLSCVKTLLQLNADIFLTSPQEPRSVFQFAILKRADFGVLPRLVNELCYQFYWEGHDEEYRRVLEVEVDQLKTFISKVNGSFKSNDHVHH